MCFSEERVKHSDIDRIEAVENLNIDPFPYVIDPSDYKYIL